MSENKMSHRIENGKILILERVFNGPRTGLFKMFKDPEDLKSFWGPRGWEVPFCKVDFRVGGTWLYCMKCIDKNQGPYFGMEAWGKGEYKEILEPEKIVYIDSFSDADGHTNSEMPSSLVTMSFVDMGHKTKIFSRTEYTKADALKSVMDMGMLQGITETWDRLEEHLAKMK